MINHLAHAHELLKDVTPLAFDCGAYCGSACCKVDEDGQGGVSLFPGETELMGEIHWGRVEKGILICEGKCPRERRPLGCRIFPLTPFEAGNGEWDVRLDQRAWAVCPLMGHGIKGLMPRFVGAAREAVRAVAKTQEGEAFLRKWQKTEDGFRRASL